jgi:hypothetical protein
MLLVAPAAHAWSQPQPMYTGASRDVLSVGGDSAGNAFVVLAGESLDEPLLLIERFGFGDDAFIWNGARPFPGGQPDFTKSSRGMAGFVSTAAGDGAGLIAWRQSAAGGSTLRALIRETPVPFSTAVMIAGTSFSPTSDISAAMNPGGDTIVAFRRGSASARGRTGYAFRNSGASFTRARTLSASATTSHVAAIGGDGSSVIAWIRGRRVETVRVTGAGKATRPTRLGRALVTGGVTAALNFRGAGVIAWRGEDGAIRLVRRTTPGPFSSSRALRESKGSIVDGFSSAVDDRGRAYVAWRERRGATRRVFAAAGPVGGRFTVTELANGKELGVPSLAARPSGGAVVSWRSPGGWQARIAGLNGVFADTQTVSKPLIAEDRTVVRAATIAGPGERVDLFWPQTRTPEEALQLPGDLVYQSYDITAAAPVTDSAGTG